MLRSHSAKRGIATTSAVLVSALSSQASTIIPAGLGVSVAAASMASAAAVGAGGFLGRHDLPAAAAWVGSAYVRSNPKAGAEWWLAQLTEKEDRRIALENIVQTWTMNDIGAAATLVGVVPRV